MVPWFSRKWSQFTFLLGTDDARAGSSADLSEKQPLTDDVWQLLGMLGLLPGDPPKKRGERHHETGIFLAVFSKIC